jgi:hypothetical protein
METIKTDIFPSVLHWGSIGDVWASLPAVRKYSSLIKKPITYYLGSGAQGEYYEGAVHPTKNEFNQQVLLNDKMIEMMIPLLEYQGYIAKAKKFEWEDGYVDLTAIRHTDINMPKGHISRWYFYVFPDLACDLSKKYIDVPQLTSNYFNDKIILNRTERYNNPSISYSFLKKYEKNILFVGTDYEYRIMCDTYDLNILKHEVKDFLELAAIIARCKVFVGNQSQAFQIAEGLKIPRIVELCNFAPNVIPIGEDAYDFYAQLALEYYVDLLFNK